MSTPSRRSDPVTAPFRDGALYLPVERRVLRRLVELARLYGGDGGGEARVPLTQEELAQLAGTSRATVNQVLREEEKRGTLELRRGATLVRDREALARRAR
jgi:CRP/FNR family transcriptional regulator, cyclic AMP receptor protein